MVPHHAEPVNFSATSIYVDHVLLLVMILPKIRISRCFGFIKGRTTIRIFKKLSRLEEKKLYWVYRTRFSGHKIAKLMRPASDGLVPIGYEPQAG